MGFPYPMAQVVTVNTYRLVFDSEIGDSQRSRRSSTRRPTRISPPSRRQRILSPFDTNRRRDLSGVHGGLPALLAPRL